MKGGLYGYLYILKEGLVKFWKDYIALKKKYPVVDLGHKGVKIQQNLDIKKRTIICVPGNKRKILSMLKNGTYSVNEIASRMFMTRQGVRYHINILEQEKKIVNVGVYKNNFQYHAIKSFK